MNFKYPARKNAGVIQGKITDEDLVIMGKGTLNEISSTVARDIENIQEDLNRLQKSLTSEHLADYWTKLDMEVSWVSMDGGEPFIGITIGNEHHCVDLREIAVDAMVNPPDYQREYLLKLATNLEDMATACRGKAQTIDG